MRAAPRDRWMLGLMAAGLALRAVLALGLHPHMVLVGDEAGYLARAMFFAATGELDTGDFVRPPLYFLVLGGLAALKSVPVALTAKLLQSAASVLTAIPVYRTALRIGGRRAARFAAAFLLFDPTLVAYSHLLWPETFYLLIVALVFDAAGRLDAEHPLRAATFGIGIGLAMLLKPVFGLYSLVLVFDWWRRLGPRSAVQLALTVGVAAALVIGPWVGRNVSRYGPAILMENQGPYNLWIGNEPQHPLRTLAEWKALPGPVERSRVGMQRGLAAIAADPGGFVARSAEKALGLWGLEFFVVRHVVAGGYGRPVSKAALLSVFYTVELAWALIWLMAALGLARVAGDPALQGVLVYAVILTGLVSAMVATTRFRVPFAFLLAVSAGVGLADAVERKLDLRAVACAAIALVVLALSASQPLFVQIGTGRFEKVEALNTMGRFFFMH